MRSRLSNNAIICMLGWLTFASIGLNNKPQFLLGFCFIRHAVFHFLWIHPLSKPAYPKIICCLSKRLKSWVFNPHPTKEDCSSYPPWILQDAPSEVTCISDWLRAYSKIANASDGASLPPESYADVLSASRYFLQRPSATSQWEVNYCNLGVGCLSKKSFACPIFLLSQGNWRNL